MKLEHLVTELILDARRGETGLTDKYLPLFRALIELKELDVKKQYIESLQREVDRVNEILDKAEKN